MTKHGAHSVRVRSKREALAERALPAAEPASQSNRPADSARNWPSYCRLWRHDIPRSMPWSLASRGTVTFTGSGIPASGDGSELPGAVKTKRRNETDEEGPSCKHFLSEEAMTKRFTCLSLSNDHIYGSNGLPVAGGKASSGSEHSAHHQEARVPPEDGGGGGGWGSEPSERRDVIVEGMFDMSDSRIIVVSPDLQRRLQGSPTEILPRNIFESMNRPCMEMMLWTPPGNLIQETIRALRRSAGWKKQEEEEERIGSCRKEDEMEL